MAQIRTFSVLSMLITLASLRVAVRNINDAALVRPERKHMSRSTGRAAPYSPGLLAAVIEEYPLTFCPKATGCEWPIGHEGPCEGTHGPAVVRPGEAPGRIVPGPAAVVS